MSLSKKYGERRRCADGKFCVPKPEARGSSGLPVSGAVLIA
jgi:hypothetical protein